MEHGTHQQVVAARETNEDCDKNDHSHATEKEIVEAETTIVEAETTVVTLRLDCAGCHSAPEKRCMALPAPTRSIVQRFSPLTVRETA